MKKYPVKNICQFMAQIDHESNGLKRRVENYIYSEKRIIEVFGHYRCFKDGIHKRYIRSPRLFDAVYANLLGNGDEASRDGSKYRGRGYIQLTGKSNYERLGYLENPYYLESSNGAWESAAKFWLMDGRLNKIPDEFKCVEPVTRIVNGSRMLGLKARKNSFILAKKVFAKGARRINV